MRQSFELPATPPLADQKGQTFPRLVELMQRLLAADGCPWDREQTYGSLRRYVREEACEVIDAIDAEDSGALREELGDLLLQVVFLTELGRKDAAFGPDDVIRTLIEKLVRRHPHVFGDVQVSGAAEVVQNWEAIKRTEKPRLLLDGVARSLPALARAQRISDRVSRVGFDWEDAQGSRGKVQEELGELDDAVENGSPEQVEHELGDLLFALVNFARHQGIDAEAALMKTADRFTARFAVVERRVNECHGGWPLGSDGKPARGLDLGELDAYWEEAKRGT